MSHVLAVDLGSSGLKIALVDRAGQVTASASSRLETIHLPGGAAEQDPEAWWTALGDCARSITAGVEVEAVAVTSQYMSIVAIDARGRPLMNTIMWMDRRGSRHLRASDRDVDIELWLDRHGLVPIGGCDQGHIATIKAERPDVYDAAAAFVEPVDYLNARLTGRITATQTTAFPLMTVDNRRHGATDHDAELVLRARLDAAKLPPIVPFDEVIGTLTADAASHLGISDRAQVVTGTIDSITSAVGSGVIDRTTCGVIIGTTTVIVTHIDRKVSDLAHGLVSVPSPLPDRWFVMAENGLGGKALDHYVHNLAFPDSEASEGFARAEGAAMTSPPGSRGVQYLPWLVGSMAPSADGGVRAGFVNIDLQSTRADMARAVYEGVAFNAAWLLPHVEAMAGSAWPSISFGGGGAASSLWAQILADATNKPVRRLANPGTTNARGAALLALAQLRHITIDDIPSLVEVADTFNPNPMNVAVYGPMIERFIELHGLLRPNRKEPSS